MRRLWCTYFERFQKWCAEARKLVSAVLLVPQMTERSKIDTGQSYLQIAFDRSFTNGDMLACAEAVTSLGEEHSGKPILCDLSNVGTISATYDGIHQAASLMKARRRSLLPPRCAMVTGGGSMNAIMANLMKAVAMSPEFDLALEVFADREAALTWLLGASEDLLPKSATGAA